MKGTFVAAMAALAGVSAGHNHRQAHNLFKKNALVTGSGEVCVPTCTTIWTTITGDMTRTYTFLLVFGWLIVAMARDTSKENSNKNIVENTRNGMMWYQKEMQGNQIAITTQCWGQDQLVSITQHRHGLSGQQNQQPNVNHSILLALSRHRNRKPTSTP